VLVHPGDDCHGIRRQLDQSLDERFAIDHTTLQVDHAPEPGLVRIGATPTTRHPQAVAAGGNGFELIKPILRVRGRQPLRPVAPPLFHNCSIPFVRKRAVWS
jgi:cobalt-zinc-cadmium efflux system protein